MTDGEGTACDRGARGGKAAYEAFKERYKMAEKWIPTRFKEYEEKGREQYFLVKNNYYCLFFLAEQVKKQFFQKEFCYQIKNLHPKRGGHLSRPVEAVGFQGGTAVKP